MFSHILCGLEVTIIYKLFCGKIAEQKKLRKLTNADLAKMTGYRKKSIEAFMCGARESEAIEKALAAAINIELGKEETAPGIPQFTDHWSQAIRDEKKKKKLE